MITEIKNVYNMLCVLSSLLTRSELPPLNRKVIELMEEKGPQSVDDLCNNLGITNGSSRSVLVRLHKANKIKRVSKGVYSLPD